MPWIIQGHTIVSDRLKEMIEQKFPGHAQFVPTQLSQNQVIQAYWVVNWLHVLEVFDLNSVGYYDEDGDYQFYDARPAIPIRRIPAEVHVFRPFMLQSRQVVSSTFRDVVETHGFTGPQFYDIPIAME
ncbi:MAG: hypothetical protein J5J06_15195 [Phycisphaerae bacterium]|nr:hypothetical protein [Phycisphaerae bacterium]